MQFSKSLPSLYLMIICSVESTAHGLSRSSSTGVSPTHKPALDNRCLHRPDHRPQIENKIWECVWPPVHEGSRWMIHRTRSLGNDIAPGAVRDLYESSYSPSERRKLIIRFRDGNTAHYTAIAPAGLCDYYHIPARCGLKDNTIVHLDPASQTMVMLNTWVDSTSPTSYMVCRRIM